jgi:sRNA-binding protein
MAPGEGGAEPGSTPRPAGASRRGGRNQRGRKPAGPAAAEGHAPAEGAARRAPRAIPPALEQLAALYPKLFGAQFLPLKRGIFQDLMAAHPELFEREALKQALGIHTRSTRYLQCVAAGQPRHDLQGQPVEAMAPEHVHQALLEVYRRRQGRGPDDLLPKLRARIVRNIEASGLTREEYAERVQTRDAAATALLDEALAELAAKQAREEALLRAFEASGKSLAEFADMYGMDPRTVERSLHSARQRAAAPAAPVAPTTDA